MKLYAQVTELQGSNNTDSPVDWVDKDSSGTVRARNLSKLPVSVSENDVPLIPSRRSAMVAVNTYISFRECGNKYGTFGFSF
jgi:hypothetical protein